MKKNKILFMNKDVWKKPEKLQSRGWKEPD